VRSLAGRSAEAAKEIKLLIGRSVSKVESGTALVAQAGQTMTEIVSSVQRVTDIMGEITAATAEQSDGIAQVNSAVTMLDTMTKQNAALVEESAAAASSMKDQARHLSEVVAKFKLKDGDRHISAPRPMAPKVALQRPTPPKTLPVNHSRPPVALAKPKAPSLKAPALKAPAPKAPPVVASSNKGDDEWETF
jgi:methyl-accepting chemotaxis protein